ncbi:embryo-specific protein ATS3A-like [Vicia villosa]|uniref:embryo-specific protein ATS3A-like n=1 Tax=Vicia villosa TaxID=3911 RepID=UPI00273B94E3|nr:embryo-specific protein ATS3A-like [Vicia villosa]
MKMALLLFLFASALTLSVSESKFDVSLKPHALDSLDVGYIQMEGAQNCSYLVIITTSCSSPKFISDEISIAFGDSYGNQVYAAKLEDSLSTIFEQCASDSFQVDGPCAARICSLYLYRQGSSDDYGWKPESVKIYGYNSDPVTFVFNTSIPKDTWYGYNFCDNAPPPPAPSSSIQMYVQKWGLFVMVLGSVFSIWM